MTQQKSEDRVVLDGGVMPAERAGSSPGGQGKAIPVDQTAWQLCLPIATAEDPDRGHEKLPTGGHLIPHPSGSGSTVRCSCTLDRREDAHEERKDTGGDHRVV